MFSSNRHKAILWRDGAAFMGGISARVVSYSIAAWSGVAAFTISKAGHEANILSVFSIMVGFVCVAFLDFLTVRVSGFVYSCITFMGLTIASLVVRLEFCVCGRATIHEGFGRLGCCLCELDLCYHLGRKCTRIEIHSISPQGLEPMLDVPIYGRIATLELFRPRGEAQDYLFIVTERYTFCVLQWDSETAELVTRAMRNVSDGIGRPTDNGQIGIIDPDCRLIGLHFYVGLFKVIPFDNNGQLKEAFNIRCMFAGKLELRIEDLEKFPHHVLIIGEETIVYCSANAFQTTQIGPSITKVYGRVDPDGSRYLLGDHKGLLSLLVIIHNNEKVIELKIMSLEETSLASKISYLHSGFVYIDHWSLVSSNYESSAMNVLHYRVFQ
ncbi:hypothetical protein V8G54_011075 [Vigna mungo]|uniref:RSE1/DDB1/CPSF1 first beta-propeller domain-containing protein n=1 Tax=Vigna mungo TaxID=3915 RepID=A0AAQ3RZ98_VIGMU